MTIEARQQPSKLLQISFALVISVLVFTSAVSAQATTGRILGTVRDESRGVLPGVTVTVTNKETGIKRTVIADDEGRYSAPSLSSGKYEIEAALTGFSIAVASGIELTVGQDAVVDLTLKVGTTSEKVTVSAEAPLVETQSSTLSGLVDEHTMRDLPLNGRDYIQLATLSVGVSQARSMTTTFSGLAGGGTKLTVNGARPDYNQVLMDGTDMQDAHNVTPGGVAGVSLGVDALREFRIMTSTYSAEFGRAGGAVINTVTKSGTNELHGSLFEYLRNSALDARNFFDKGNGPPHFLRNQFGFTVGGPIVRDHTFFFGSYEGLRQRLATTQFLNVPTPLTRQGFLPLRNNQVVPTNQGGVSTFVGVHPAIQPYLNLFPLPTPGGIDNLDGSAQFIKTLAQPIDENYYVMKIDHTLSDSDSFFGRFLSDSSDETLFPNAPPFAVTNFAARRVLTLEEKKIVSPTLLNVLRFGLNRANVGVILLDPKLDPSLSFVPGRFAGDVAVGGLSTVGLPGDGGSDFVRSWTSYEVSDTVNYTRGRHSIVLGGNFKRIQDNGVHAFSQYGTFSFTTLKEFLQNTPSLLDVALPQSNFVRGWRLWLLGAFIQDDFQISKQLTFNLGLRYDFVSVPKEVNGLVSNIREANTVAPDGRIPANANFTIGDPFYNNPSKLNFAPRIGFAWSPFGGGKSSIRGGFGIFYASILPANFQAAGFSSYPFTARLNIPNPAFPRGWLQQDTASLLPNLFVQPFDFHPSQPLMYQYNLTVQQEIPFHLALTLGYTGSRGRHLSRVENVNMNRFVTQPDGSKFFPVGTTRPNRNFGVFGLITYDTNSAYDSLQVALAKRLSAGLQFQGAYTFSKMMDATAGQNGSSNGGTTTTMDPFDWRRDWSVSSFHVPHNFSFSAVYDLPSFKSAGVAAKILGGWQASSIVRLASGIPVKIQMAGTFDPARAGTWWPGDNNTLRPDLVPGANSNPRIENFDPNNRYMDPSAFSLPAAGTFGNLGRYTLIGPGLATLDFSLVKKTSIAERASAEFRAEFFNVLNRANFSSPNGSLFANASGAPSATFGRITTTATTSRQIQFGLKLIF